MPTRIDMLTDAQRAAMPAYAAEWIARGLDLTPADRPAAEQAYRDCYRLAGLAEPKRIVWVQSPLALALAGPLAAVRLGDDAVGGVVSGAVRGVVSVAVRGVVSGVVDDAVGGAVRDAVGDAVDDAVRGAVGGACLLYTSDAADE